MNKTLKRFFNTIYLLVVLYYRQYKWQITVVSQLFYLCLRKFFQLGIASIYFVVINILKSIHFLTTPDKLGPKVLQTVITKNAQLYTLQNLYINKKYTWSLLGNVLCIFLFFFYTNIIFLI